MTDNNIQRLYELAGVDKKPVHSGSQLYNPVITGYSYPPFTAEKQLELIKFVGKLKENNEIGIEYQKDNNLWCTCLRDTYDECLNIWAHHKHFDQALAGLILELWDKLSSEQREEVREILQ